MHDISVMKFVLCYV